jgi:hypothetical protein
MGWSQSRTFSNDWPAARHSNFSPNQKEHTMSTIKPPHRKNGATSQQSVRKSTARADVTPNDIRCRAYEIYCDRCDKQGKGGDHVSDWLRAEQELTGASQGVPTANRSSEQKSQARPEAMSQARRERLVHA